MLLTSTSASRFSRLFLTAATLLVIACKEATTPIGRPTRLAFTTQPVTTTAVTVIPTVQVAVQDGAGNTIESATTSISLSIATNQGNGATLIGATTVSAVNGVATFSDLTISKAATGYVLLATATNLFSAYSGGFDVNAGPASTLAFTSQPGQAISGDPITPAVTVTVRDAASNIVTTATNNITVAIGTNPGGGTLSGTTSVVPVAGVATFSNLSINNPGNGYTLTAGASNLTAATSTSFTIRNPLVFSVVSAGYFHTCGVTTGGAAYCWGDNANYQLGHPGVSVSTVPILVSGGLTFAKVVAGRDHTCGVNAGGVAYCWGLNDGRLGTASSSGSDPTVVSGNRTFAATSAGYIHTCGVTTAGAGYCWGDNSSGELGDGTINRSGVPVAVSGTFAFASISPGRYFSCGLTTGGTAHCWGDNAFGELGDGTNAQRSSAVAVSGGYSFASVSAGGFHACGLTTGGVAYCWGLNSVGQLGNGTLTDVSVPVAVSGNRTFATISAGNRHTCGVTTGGAAFCWGDNLGGYLGNGTTTKSPIPAAVSGGYTFASVSAGRFHTCGVTTGGTAYCWGNSYLGNGTASSLVPVPIR